MTHHISKRYIVEKLQRKYAPRTVQLHVMTLRQILNWAWKKQKIPMQITVHNKRPNGEKGYVNNRHTPTDADVEKAYSDALSSAFGSAAKLMLRERSFIV